MKTTVSHSSQLKLTKRQIQKIIELGGTQIVGNMLDDNFAENEDLCKTFFIYNSKGFVCKVDKSINVIE